MLLEFTPMPSPFPPIHRTLPLSGRQIAWGGEAKSGRWPVHLEGLVGRHFRLRQQLLKFLPAEINIPQDLRQQPRSN